MIARELGISDPAVHYHFPSKQALYEALLVLPDYGPLPLDRQPLSRATLVDQVMHLFGWWTSRPEFGQMLLREQLSSEATSVAFIGNASEAWHAGVTEPLGRLLGEDASDTSEMLFDMLAGVFWDAILSFGNSFAESVGQDFFLRRVRMMVDLAIPGQRLEGL